MTQPLAVGLGQAAAMIGIAPRTLRKWATERRLRSIKLGGRLLFRLHDLEKLLAENERPAEDGPRKDKSNCADQP